MEQLAASHIDINHQESTGQQAFACITIEELYKDDISDVLKKLRSKFRPKSPMFLAIKYIWNGYDAGSSNEMKNLMGGFVILDHYEKDNQESSIAAETTAEEIVEDVIAKIIADSRNGEFWVYSTNTPTSFNVTPFDRISNYIGWQVTFEFGDYLNINVNQEKWQ